MAAGDDRITIFIPTLATPARVPYLRTAAESVRAQSDVDVRIVVIANGPGCEPEALASLEHDLHAKLIRRVATGFPAALRAGREAVETPFFGELDDDDELLPGTLARRLDEMRRDTALAVVVSNGVLRGDGHDVASIANIEAVRRDPMRSLLESNWLLPGSALFRTDAVPADWFASIPRCLEWTYLGLLLSRRCPIGFLAEPGVVHYEHRPFSTYDSRDCRVERVRALEALLSLELPGDVKRRIRRKIGDACHDLSHMYLNDGDRHMAWRQHLRSLAYPGGWRFLAHTRHLCK